jgi:hypothetical protein
LKVEKPIFSSFAQCGSNPHRIILGMRIPLFERIATNIGSVGGLFQLASKFGRTESGANCKRILISE